MCDLYICVYKYVNMMVIKGMKSWHLQVNEWNNGTGDNYHN